MHSADGASGSNEEAQIERNSDTALQEQHRQAVVWLLLAVPAAATTADLLVRIPTVPVGEALQLVKAGVRITYAQLLAAACSMVAGVEVWVQEQQQLGIQTDIPAPAVAVCCVDKVSFFRLWPVVAIAAFRSVIECGLTVHCA
jgi:hypothetical protein